MKPPITYQMLFDKLRACGFLEEVLPLNGHTRRVFQLPTEKSSVLNLPDQAQRPAAGLHIGAVKVILERYGLIDEDSWITT